jgi:hypothetical protein
LGTRENVNEDGDEEDTNEGEAIGMKWMNKNLPLNGGGNRRMMRHQRYISEEM